MVFRNIINKSCWKERLMSKLISITPLRDALFQHSRPWHNPFADYSVTALTKPPRIVQLERRHQDYFLNLPMDEDQMDKQLPSFKGNAIHRRFEMMLKYFKQSRSNSGYLIEQRVFDRIRDRLIVGKFDVYKNSALYDIKTTSVWKYIFKQFKDWEEQLNLYAWFCTSRGIDIKVLYVIAWLMDWDKYRINQDDYPKKEIVQILLDNLWSPEEQKKHLDYLIDRQKANEDRSDDDLDFCTDEERWAKPDQFAVKAPEGKRAIRVLDTEAKAKEYIKRSKKPKKEKETWSIECRKGGCMRCEGYCKVNIFCNQYQAEKGVAENEKTKD